MNIFRRKKNILVIGKDGMLGREVYNKLVRESLLAFSCINKVVGLSHDDIDITREYSLDSYLSNFGTRFDYVINCVAMTDTIGAENDKRDHSYNVNALACKKLAEDCSFHGAHLIHISTDYVFSYCGIEHNPYFSGFTPDMDPTPVNMYGIHKLIGEQFIIGTMPKNKYTILRTSWLYGEHNKKSFIHKFIKNLNKTITDGSDTIPCTSNEYSIPTSTYQLAQMIYNVIKYNITGVHHAAGRSSSPVSRLEWANIILKTLKSNPVTTKQYSAIKSITPVVVHDSNITRPECSMIVEYADEKRKLYDDIELDWAEEVERFINDNIISFIGM